jgi:hypothetical protein
MKPASEWALEFLNKHVLNTRASREFERFIAEVQKDVIKDAVERDETIYEINERLPFRKYFEKRNGRKYNPMFGEIMDNYILLLMDTIADYIDEVVK